MTGEGLTEQSLLKAARQLARRDKDLAFILKNFGPPPLWARQPSFSTLIQIILEQQVSLASAAAIFSRLKSNTAPFRPETLVQLGEPHLKSLGLTRQKTSYCLDLAQSLVDNRLKLSRLKRMSDDEARSMLMNVKGLGYWSADVYLLMALRRPDIWPNGDIALASALRSLRNMDTRPSFDELEKVAETWRPFRSVAARMLWHYYLSTRKEARRNKTRLVMKGKVTK